MMQTAELRSLSYFFFDQHSLYIQGLAYLNRWEDFITSIVKGIFLDFFFLFKIADEARSLCQTIAQKKVQGENNAYLDSFQ